MFFYDFNILIKKNLKNYFNIFLNENHIYKITYTTVTKTFGNKKCVD
jgi:hypothetical protein